MSTEKKTVEVDAKGIPLKSSYPENPTVPVLYAMFTVIPGLFGLVIAYATITFASSESSKSAADAKLDLLATYDLGWLYLGIFVVKLLQLPIAIILGSARKASKVNVPDQHVYRVMGSEGSKLGHVLMETEDDDLGKFNRAQRALQNYHEQFPTMMLQYVAASFVWPFETFVCIAIWAVSCVLSANGYVSSADGRMQGRLPGFFAAATVQGLVLIAAHKALSA
eukprot:CAMPEP_0181031424 /NCGR_PEP_ID=MMETSP1070-20121207/6225_1 /TAXON_ID=265543 /ORGANISM="Minutocellus polymorphus, Strain NH13" /LENGTH=222 /DNA_ID=CAMNT_0023108801 /DNA_START=82 /DNA_END=750 /DNA_ORIENTATION=+